MSSGLASLHKILKDETRRKIILLLNEKGDLSYTNLMKALEIDNTGRMNYHLKVLNDLVLKREDGQYVLTEKGKLASRLLLEFPEQNRQELRMKPKWWRRFWIEAAITSIILLAILLAAYFLGYIDLTGLYQGILTIIGGVGVAYMSVHVTRDVLSKRARLLFNKIGYIVVGAFLGSLISFFGSILLILLVRFLGGPDLAHLEGGGELWILATVVLIIVGGIAGYRFGKKRGFRSLSERFQKNREV